MSFLKRAWIEISLGNLRYNYYQIKSLLYKDVIIMAVLKADGYGCGDVRLAQELEKTDKSIQFAVSNLNEAIKLRKNGIKNPILILGYTPIENTDDIIEFDITQTIVSFEHAEKLTEKLRNSHKKLKAHIKIDTGMGRLGIVCYDENIQAAENQVKEIYDSKVFNIIGCFTHISTFYENDISSKEYCVLQYERFKNFTDMLKADGLKLGLLHCLNSAGTANMPYMQLDMVRTGTLLYGVLPDMYNHSGIRFKPIAEIKACIAKVSDIKKGTYIGYSRAFCADRDMKVAILTIGYSDILRMGNGKGEVLINDTFCPVIGGVCMDQMAVDISNAGKVEPEDTAVIFGRFDKNSISITQMAEFLGCGEEEIYCHITPRPEKVYYGGYK